MTLKSIEFVLPLADPGAVIETVGGKGASLARLISANFSVPNGFHVTTAAYVRFVQENDLQQSIEASIAKVDAHAPSTLEAASNTIQDLFMKANIPEEVASSIVSAYAELEGGNPIVAVRSSATAEDLPEASFAGQQETFLNIHGAVEVLNAVKRCWASLWTARAIGYRIRQGVSIQGLSLAVVVQKMVAAEAAGILFTANPLNGNRDQVVINAAWGLGEAIVGGQVTPDLLIVEKHDWRIVQRQTADKQVMTVRTNGSTELQTVPDALRKLEVLSDEQVVHLSQLGTQIEGLYQGAVDIEWVLADGEFSVVQARPVTGLPEVVIPSPEEWQPPKPKARYMRASIIDFMSNPLSPLFATMGVSAYNKSIQEALEEMTGKDKAKFPGEIIETIHDYAYMNASYTAGEWWALASLVPKFPKLLGNGAKHFRNKALPTYQRKVNELSVKSIDTMNLEEIWKDAHILVEAAMYHMSILQVDTLGASAGSEGLFTNTYNKFYKKEHDPTAPSFLMGYNNTPILAEKSVYDLAMWIKHQQDLAEFIHSTETEQIVAAFWGEDTPSKDMSNDWEEFKKRLQTHLDEFGYMLFDLDFSQPVPAENPTPQIEMIKIYLSGEGVNPYERQARLQEKREAATRNLRERLHGISGWVVTKTLGWAQSMAEVREDSIASIGLAYPRLRMLLLEIGNRLVKAGVIEKPEDVFWLEESEIEARLVALERDETLESLQSVCEERKKIRKAEARVIPPAQLPFSKTYMGIPIEVFMPGGGGEDGHELKGVGASSGKVTGVACVLHGPEDFDQMQPGGILVAPQTNPAWTPLFTMASAVVTDIGGPLSHGSIVAREYGIPAVLGTGVATRRIHTGQRITVDGTQGMVTIEDN